MENLKLFLGVSIKQFSEEIFIRQTKHSKELIKKDNLNFFKEEWVALIFLMLNNMIGTSKYQRNMYYKL